MRKYETFFIIDPDLTEEAYTLASEKLKGVVNANGGEVFTYVPWGKKKLAYSVKKRTQGLYTLMEYGGGPQLVAELERNMRLDERVLKFITVKLDDRFDPEKEKAQKTIAPPAFGQDEEVAEDESGETEKYETAVEEESARDEEEVDEEQD